MRSYTVAIASLAIGAPTKWTDNVLSQHDIPHVVASERGVARKISHEALVQLALIRQLHVDVGMSVSQAIQTSAALLHPAAHGSIQLNAVALTVNMPLLQKTLALRLADALESAPTPRRGRPPVRGT